MASNVNALLTRLNSSWPWRYGALLLLLIYVAQLGKYGVDNHDTYFHVRAGQEMLNGGWRPWHMGHFGTQDSAQWVSTQWLPQVGMALIVQAGGLTALMWAGVIGYVAFFLIAYRILRSYADALPVIVGLAAFAWACASYISLRPQLFSFLFVLVITHLFLRAARNNRVPWLIVPVMALWPNFHGMWIAGVVNVWVLCVAWALQHGVARSWRTIALAPLATLATLATPLGVHAWTGAIAAVGRGGVVTSMVTEWSPPLYSEPRLFVAFLLLAATVITYMTRSHTTWLERGVLFLALGWSVWSARSVPFAFLMLLLLLLPAAHSAMKTTLKPVGVREFIACCVMGALGVTAFGLVKPATPTAYTQIPVWLDARLDGLDAGSVVFTDFDAGSYSLYRHPDLNMFIHGYGDAFNEAEIDRLYITTLQYGGWPEQVRDTGARYAAWPKYSSVAYNLQEQGWIIVEGDENYLFLRAPADWSQRNFTE